MLRQLLGHRLIDLREMKMIQIDPRADATTFFTKLSQARDSALMLDYDGTLAPFRIGRDRAFPYPGVQEVLREITARDNSRLVIVTGRPAKDVTLCWDSSTSLRSGVAMAANGCRRTVHIGRWK